MKKYFIKIVDYFSQRIIWKLFLALLINLLLVISLSVFSAKALWEWRVRQHVKLLEDSLTSKVVDYWQGFYATSQSWPDFLKDPNDWSSEIKNMLQQIQWRRFYLIIVTGFLESITILDEKKNIVSADLEVAGNSDLISLFEDKRRYKNKSLRGKKRWYNRFEDDEHDQKNDDEHDRKNDKDYEHFWDMLSLVVAEDDFDIKEHPIFYKQQLVGWIKIPVVSKDFTALDRVLEETEFRFFWILLIAGGITFSMAYLLSHWLLKPVFKINDGLQSLEKSDFSYRIKLSRKDELGNLARNFDAMAEQMADFAARKKRWIATISHELRTPLTILLGEIEAMIDKVRPFNEDNLLSLKKEILDLTALTKDLQELASYDHEQTPADWQKIEVNRLIAKTIKKYDLLFAKKGLQTVFNSKLDEIKVLADAKLLQRAFSKILENSLTHTTKGPVIISSEFQDGTWILSIEDFGPGLQNSELAKIFDYFYRPADSPKQASGSGLGLAICRSIVTMHGGQIKAEQSAGGGLKIIIAIKAQN